MREAIERLGREDLAEGGGEGALPLLEQEQQGLRRAAEPLCTEPAA